MSSTTTQTIIRIAVLCLSFIYHFICERKQRRKCAMMRFLTNHFLLRLKRRAIYAILKLLLKNLYSVIAGKEMAYAY